MFPDEGEARVENARPVTVIALRFRETGKRNMRSTEQTGTARHRAFSHDNEKTVWAYVPGALSTGNAVGRVIRQINGLRHPCDGRTSN